MADTVHQAAVAIPMRFTSDFPPDCSGSGRLRSGSGCLRPGDLRPGHLRPGLLWGTPEGAGDAIVEAVAAGRAVRYVPAYWRAIMAVVRLLPDSIAARLKA